MLKSQHHIEIKIHTEGVPFCGISAEQDEGYKDMFKNSNRIKSTEKTLFSM